MLSLTNLKCDNQKNPKALYTTTPYFSWQLLSDKTNVLQSNYRLFVWKDDETLYWDSKIQNSSQCTYIPYAGIPLEANTFYSWQVQITDNYNESSISEKECFTTSYLDSPWKAKWITSGEKNTKGGKRPVEVFHKIFNSHKDISKAKVRISAMGLYKLFINGAVVCDDCFTPGYTSYSEYIQYQTYDVTEFMKDGKQDIFIYLANGWYCGKIMFKSNIYGEYTALIAEFEINYSDGTKELWITDAGWNWSKDGPIRFSEFYDGEIYDANREAILEDSYKQAVLLETKKLPKLIPHFGTAVKRQMEITPLCCFHNKNNELIYDMGQNFAGWIRLKVKEKKGTHIVVSHSEILGHENCFYEGSHFGAKSQLEYICSGDGEENYEPYFTFMGFRYVKVEGIKNGGINNITGIVAYSDMEQTGEFNCSNEKVNKLWQNTLWGQKSNFLEIPTDCPQRGERLGWLGDIALFARAAAFNMDIRLFIRKWLTDLKVEHDKYGKLAFIIPDIGMMGSFRPSVAGWGDAAVIVPWLVYLTYGDKSILEQQYGSMKKWVEAERKKASKRSGNSYKKYIWSTGFQFGDWLAPQGNFFNWMGKKKWLSTAYFAYSTQLLGKTAEILGKDDDAVEYGKLFEKIKNAFCREFLNRDGRLTGDFQSAYACALYFDLIPDELKEKSAKRLASLIDENDGCLATGFLGTPWLTFALGDNNQLEAAYKLLLNEKCPSWIYAINHGATTVWECWDLINEDGTLKGTKQGKEPKTIRSFNHYAYGSVCDWLYRRVAGLEQTDPGYSHFIVRPMPGGGLTHCSLKYKSVYGEISVFWEIADGDKFRLSVNVPANSKATIVLPDGTSETAGSGTWNYNITLKTNHTPDFSDIHAVSFHTGF